MSGYRFTSQSRVINFRSRIAQTFDASTPCSISSIADEFSLDSSLQLTNDTLPLWNASDTDEPVVRKAAGTSGTIHYYHRNQQYSITAMTTSTGAVAERYAYTAYGQPTILNASGSVLTSSAVGNRYTYTGREWDETLGLHHFRARWMSPLAGRFLGRDPIGYGGSEWGLYEFLDSSSLHSIDWMGLFTLRNAAKELCEPRCAGTHPRNLQACIDRCAERDPQGVFDKWIEMEHDRIPWWDELPKCPDAICIKHPSSPRGSISILNPDPARFEQPNRIGYFEHRFHPGGYYSMRSKGVDGHSNQCVYNSDGKLIREAPGHGTVDWRETGLLPFNHMDHDVHPVIAAAMLDGCWDSNGIGLGFIKPNCSGENMQRYFGVRPLLAEEPSGKDPCDCGQDDQ